MSQLLIYSILVVYALTFSSMSLSHEGDTVDNGVIWVRNRGGFIAHLRCFNSNGKATDSELWGGITTGYQRNCHGAFVEVKIERGKTFHFFRKNADYQMHDCGNKPLIIRLEGGLKGESAWLNCGSIKVIRSKNSQ